MAQHPSHSQDHRHPGQPNPIEVQKALHGVDYPTTREKLVEAARSNGANQDIVDLVGELVGPGTRLIKTEPAHRHAAMRRFFSSCRHAAVMRKPVK